MSIIVEDKTIEACLSCENGILAIQFDDPTYIRAEQVVVTRNGEVGVIFEQGFHHIGPLPDDIDRARLHTAHLTAQAHDLRLRAPIKLT